MGASSVPKCYRNAANIGSKGLYGALRVLFGVGLEACWLDQTIDLTRGAYLRLIREPFEMVPIRNLEVLSFENLEDGLKRLRNINNFFE